MLDRADYGDTSFITGVRALAAIGVLLIHAGGGGLRELGVIGNNVADMGRTGVYVFFVISGFSVACSYASSRGFRDYMFKRLWRIAPPYYLWILICTGMTVYYYRTPYFELSVKNILLHLTFLSNFDPKISGSIIGVEWTIPIEIFWYVLTPLMMVIFNRKISTLFYVAITWALCTYSINNYGLLPMPSEEAALVIHYSPIPYSICFALGLLTYRIRPILPQRAWIGNAAMLVAICAMVFYVMRPLLVLKYIDNEILFISLVSFAVLCFGCNESLLIRMFFYNRLAQFLGVISYGIYLAHFPVISYLQSLKIDYFDVALLKFLMVFALTTLVATLSYILIEKPCIQLGRKLSQSRI